MEEKTKIEVLPLSDVEAMFEKREKQFDEEERKIFAKAFSSNGGVLSQGKTEDEMKKLVLLANKEAIELQYKYLDIMRKRAGIPIDEMNATFGEDFDHRWKHLVKEHIIKDEKGNELNFYEDVDGNYQQIIDEQLTINDMEFMVRHPDKFADLIPDDDKIIAVPSINIWGFNIDIPKEYFRAEKPLDPATEYKQQLITIARFVMDKLLSLNMSGIKEFPVLLDEIKDKLSDF